MSLLASEIQRVKYELGYPTLTIAAEPYVGYVSLFDQVIQPYLASGATTTSASSIAAATTPTVASVVLADATGFAAGATAIIDVDSLQERATIRSISGSTIQVLLSKAHSGTYPVTVEGGESIVRGILQRIQSLTGLSVGAGDSGAMGSSLETAGVKRIDEIEFFGPATSGSSKSSTTQIQQLVEQREYWRDELASVLGVERLNRMSGRDGGSTISVF